MATQRKPEYSKDELQKAEILWDKFIQFSKVGIVAVVIIVALMALFLV